MAYKECMFQSQISKYLKKSAWCTFPYELKVSAGKTVRFGSFQEHQLPKLWDAKHGIQHHKISDSAIGFKPYDGYVFKEVDNAYVGLLFEKDKQHKECYFIDIDEVYKLKEIPNKKSITLDDAKRLGKKIVL